MDAVNCASHSACHQALLLNLNYKPATALTHSYLRVSLEILSAIFILLEITWE